ncbi:uncharacterized protein [Parasteatoda tepidariorum]|nr:uncharacterized protein LOC107453484 isoform X2 [Parasteatoda tepidariorum]XP_015925831.1 uncharacterized protein LOC107453484 isoform X2 [Parasteatoda tepidariorum]
MERNIPDVRNIFGKCTVEPTSKPKPELRSYDYSPRSRRRFEDFENFDVRPTTTHNTNANETKSNVSNSNRRNSRHRSTLSDDLIEPTKHSKKGDDAGKKSSKGKDASHYSNRTLTERDIRHLERTLSMKKTIRKQISRNLAQAFVDDPDSVLKEFNVPMTKTVAPKVVPDNMFTLTRAKVSKSEQNVLDLLKDNEPDSGHCSADNPNSSDDDTQDQVNQLHIVKPKEKTFATSRVVPENPIRPDQPCKEEGKFSFWKMFSNKHKGKR